MEFSEIIPSVSIANLVNQRNGIVERLTRCNALLEEAQQTFRESVPDANLEKAMMGETWWKANAPFIGSSNPLPMIVHQVDAQFWDRLLSDSGIQSFMHSESRASWRRAVESGRVPEFTMPNIRSAFRDLYAKRDLMMLEGVLNVFRSLSWWDFKSNSPVKLEPTVILNGFFSGGSKCIEFEVLDRVEDLIRALCRFDNKPAPDHRNGPSKQIRDVWLRGAHEWNHEYLRIRWYAKGTCHITFKRLDLLEQINKMIARAYPNALPAAA